MFTNVVLYWHEQLYMYMYIRGIVYFIGWFSRRADLVMYLPVLQVLYMFYAGLGAFLFSLVSLGEAVSLDANEICMYMYVMP